MYGRVVNKHARHNLCFAEHNQEPDYLKGQGRVVAFDRVPIMARLRAAFGQILAQAENLQVEGNYYYDIKKCGIGFHGDAERRKVIGVRFGASFPLVFAWFHRGKPITPVIDIKLEHGDIYFMSEKATGFDWRQKSKHTLRHAAGADKYIKPNPLRVKVKKQAYA